MLRLILTNPQLATDRFDEIIDRTQVVDSPFHTSQLMKDKKSPISLLSAFMSEPTRNINILVSAIYSGDPKRIARAFTTYAVETVVNTAFATSIYTMRGYSNDDDKEKTFWERYKKYFKGNFIDSIIPISSIPVAKDIFEIIMKYDEYNVSGSGMSQLPQVERAAAVIREYMKIYNGSKSASTMKAANATIRLASEVTGIGAYNLWRDVRALTAVINREILGNETYDDRINEAAEYRMNGDMKAYQTVLNELSKEHKHDDVIKDIDKRTNKLQREKNEAEKAGTSPAPTEEPKLYQAKDVTRALEAGRVYDAQKVIDYLLDNAGKVSEENLKNKRTGIKGSITAYYKKLSKTERNKAAKMLERLKYDGEYFYTSKDISEIEKKIEENAQK